MIEEQTPPAKKNRQDNFKDFTFHITSIQPLHSVFPSRLSINAALNSVSYFILLSGASTISRLYHIFHRPFSNTAATIEITL